MELSQLLAERSRLEDELKALNAYIATKQKETSRVDSPQVTKPSATNSEGGLTLRGAVLKALAELYDETGKSVESQQIEERIREKAMIAPDKKIFVGSILFQLYDNKLIEKVKRGRYKPVRK